MCITQCKYIHMRFSEIYVGFGVKYLIRMVVFLHNTVNQGFFYRRMPDITKQENAGDSAAESLKVDDLVTDEEVLNKDPFSI